MTQIEFDFIDAHRLKPGKRVALAKTDTTSHGPFEDKNQGVEFTHSAVHAIRKLQYRLYTESKQSLLIVLQAPDAAGKDGLIRKVLGQMNPQGCQTYPFKVPTPEEAAHDFLWRIHRCTPESGQVAIFNRSHYEDVLVVRVEQLVPAAVWKQRYQLINAFENLLVHGGTRILKFYLHISPGEQLKRFGERLEDPSKHWKLNPGDYSARDKADAYYKAYEDVFAKCNAAAAPWHIIPADKKWYRDAAVAAIVRDTLNDMNPQTPPTSVDVDEMRRLYERELAETHAVES